MRFAFVLSLAVLAACGGPASTVPVDSGVETGAVDAPAADSSFVDAAVPDAGPPLHVLFLGNSYTYVNDLPNRLHVLASVQTDSRPIEVSSVTVGAATLGNLWLNPNVKSAIAAGGNDFVVLQGQSVEPLVSAKGFHDYGLLLAGAAKDANAAPVFYETWARKTGAPEYLESWSGGSPDAMQDLLLAGYVAVTKDAGAKLAPVGEAFRIVWQLHPSIELYDPDGSHPSAAGTYLAACVFYDALIGTTFVATDGVPDGVSPADAATLRDAAAKAVASLE